MVGLCSRQDGVIRSAQESAMLRNGQKIVCFIDQAACRLSTGGPSE